MNSKEIRQSFLDFFESKNHRIVPSASVVPHGDPTLLFTNAGMNQFKDVFLGSGTRDYSRAADTQKCIRVSGKHNDLEEVGVDTYHHTFFEMLGNWSFGDYYKEEAIEWAWELLTKVWGLDPKRLFATVYRTDDEAYEIWKKFLPTERIQRFDEKDNFWEMGETGPCGPCSEVHYDRTPDHTGARLVNIGSPDVIEIWNLVFIQYNRKADGSLEELAAKHVDTGMGFERICAVIQGKSSNYDTDIFRNIIAEIERFSGRKYSGGLNDKDSIAMRVIADHLRTLSFAISDGAMPGNEGRGYVLRRILRRACRFARNLGFNEPVMYKLIPSLIDTMGTYFTELVQHRETITRVIKGEEESFLQMLDRGLEIFDRITERLEAEDAKVISGADTFQLYDTFGFPLDLTELMAREKGLAVDVSGFNEKMKEQKERSRQARKVRSQEVELPLTDLTSIFTGYSTFIHEAELLYVVDNQAILDRTPFYAESGGQVSDTGTLIIAGESYNVIDVKKSGNAIVHICDREIEPLIGSAVLARVDESRRRDIMKNHSATHLMHEALRRVLGSHVQQAGSLVAPDYLRFDFNHFEKVSQSQLKEIEGIVNEKIMDAVPVQTEVLELGEARKNTSIKMFFGDKYGERVRVVTMDRKYSLELCGGTHIGNTSEIGLFKIVSESSIAAGVRRIEAVTGRGVERFLADLENKLAEKQEINEELSEKIRKLERQISGLKLDELMNGHGDPRSKSKRVDGIYVFTEEVAVSSIDELRSVAENLRNNFGTNGIGLLAAILDGKIQIACAVTDDLKDRLPAGKLVGSAAKLIGGGGGGKPHLATAGGKDIEKLPLLLENFPDIIKSFIS